MDYIITNKLAWEDAFSHRTPEWGDHNAEILRSHTLPFFNNDTIVKLKEIDLTNKTIAQFCCNNGRELLSAMQLNPNKAVGFDIAENIIEQARETASKLNLTNCYFEACNILEINSKYYNSFDLIFFTIGAITWFQDLETLFRVVNKCLKPNGVLLINDFHPFINMLPMPGEDSFDPTHLDRVAYSYFRTEPWIEDNGMSYMTPTYYSKTFISFSHTMANIVNAALKAELAITSLNEYDYDVGMTDAYNGKGYPLSFLLTAQK